MKNSNFRQFLPSLAGMFLFFLTIAPTKANTIVGPTLNQNVLGWRAAGIAFTPLQNCILTSFVFENQGAADTLALFSSFTTIAHSLATPAGNPSYSVSGLNWSLTAGRTYYLVDLSNPSNGRFGAATFPVSDVDIRVTAGVFSDSSTLITDSSLRTDFWANFNDITTVTSVPDTGSSVLLLGSALIALILFSIVYLTSQL